MPTFATTLPLSLLPGETVALFNAESPATGVVSQAVALPPNVGGAPAVLSFTVNYTAAPTATLTVLAGDVASAAGLVATTQVSTNKQNDRVELTTGAAFAAIAMTSYTSGGPVTVTCHRGV
ncbi:MAG: hypothetical protein ACRD2E_11545 [Terriglobales bacterium]